MFYYFVLVILLNGAMFNIISIMFWLELKCLLT